MQFDWWTLAFQTVNFLVLVWLLQRFLYRPVRRVIAQRKELAGRVLAEAEAARQQAAAERDALAADRARIAEEREALLAQAHDEAAAAGKALLAEAEREAAARLAAGRDMLAADRVAALAAARQQAVTLAGEIAQRLLVGMAGPDGLAEASLAQIVAALQAMPVADRVHLQRDLAGDGMAPVVITAVPLDDAGQARWAARIGALLEGAAPARFAVEEGLLGGAELRLPHSRLTFALADQLMRAQQAVGADDTAAR